MKSLKNFAAEAAIAAAIRPPPHRPAAEPAGGVHQRAGADQHSAPEPLAEADPPRNPGRGRYEADRPPPAFEGVTTRPPGTARAPR